MNPRIILLAACACLLLTAPAAQGAFVGAYQQLQGSTNGLEVPEIKPPEIHGFSSYECFMYLDIKSHCAFAWVHATEIDCGYDPEPGECGDCTGGDPGETCMVIGAGGGGEGHLLGGWAAVGGFVNGLCDFTDSGDRCEVSDDNHIAWHAVGEKACHTVSSTATNMIGSVIEVVATHCFTP